MVLLIAAASVVTLYCDVYLQTSSGKKEPSSQRIFTIDYNKSEIFVVGGHREGQVLKAKSITATTIEFPEYGTLDLFESVDHDSEGSGIERINRVTGDYEARINMIKKPVISFNFLYKGSCKSGEIVPIPEAKF